MALLLPGVLMACLAAGAVASPAAASGEEAVLSALEAGDECGRGPGGTAAEQEACSIHALQRRGQVLRRTVEDATKDAAEDATEASAERSLGRSKSRAAVFEAVARDSGWSRERRCEGHRLHELGFVVQQSGEQEMQQMALDRSDPSSPNYRRWLSWKEVLQMSRNEQSLLELRQALAAVPGVSVLQETLGGMLLRAQAPISTWEQLLSTEFHVYRHADSNQIAVRTPSYLLPRHIDSNVIGILNAIDLEMVRPSRLESVDLSIQAGPGYGFPTYEELLEWRGRAVITPEKLREAYGVPPIAPRGSQLAEQRANTSQLVFATLGQHWSPSDRSTFEIQFGIPTDNYVRQLDMGNGKAGEEVCRFDGNRCAEANLDVQYMMAMSPWAKIGFWHQDQPNVNGLYHFLLDFHTRFFTTEEQPAHVISISYGMPEIGVSDAGLVLFESMAMKLSLAGVTILAASGDDGAASFLARRPRHGNWCWSVESVGLQVSFPASSEWVTGVGGTLGAGLGETEIACSINATGPAAETNSTVLITTGGGFSQALKRPRWQDGHHNETGRGVPDLSIASHAYATVIGQNWVTADGTSAASPALAGMLSLINAELVGKNLPTIGFLNTLIYSNKTLAAIFTDVVQGDNKCGAAGYTCCGGYDAGEGWDAVTGLGVPSWKKLREAVLKFPELLSATPEPPAEEVDREEIAAKEILDADAMKRQLRAMESGQDE